MGLEIERKFLLSDEAWRAQIESSQRLAQGYLGGTRASVRVRVGGGRGWLNIKSRELGHSRLEYEYEIPLADAEAMLARLADGAVIEKTRHRLRYGAHCWEIDEFYGENQGLIVAEIELQHPAEAFERPPWLGIEVTDDPRYYNSNLVAHPYSQWRRA
jgi:adenylate cyclase